MDHSHYMKTKMNGKCINIRFLMVCFAFLYTAPEIQASNYVKVAVIGDLPRIDIHQEPQKLVEQVIHFWEKQLLQVLIFKPDIIVLPEVCDRPVGMSRDEQFQYYQVRKDQVKEYFASVARENHCYIAFGTKHQTKNRNWYNSIFILDRNGLEAGVYHKNFPTIGELESGIKPGNETPVIQCDFGNVVCAICYDLNFPELRMQYEKVKPDLILFPSMFHGGLVQQYWAYSCRSFFIGALGFRTIPSEIRNPLGEVIAGTTNYFNYAVTTINLDRQLVHLDGNWEKLIRLKEKYGDDVTIKDPGYLGSVLVSSEAKDISVIQMLNEFNIELLDDYFNRSREVRQYSSSQ